MSEDFKLVDDSEAITPTLTVERTGEQINEIKIDFNKLTGRPILQWYGRVLTITFDRSVEGQVQ